MRNIKVKMQFVINNKNKYIEYLIIIELINILLKSMQILNCIFLTKNVRIL